MTAAALGAAGFAIGVMLCRIGSGRTPPSAEFARLPEFSVWCVVTGFEVALWVLCGLSARGVERDIKARLPPAPLWPFVVVLIALVVAVRIGLLLYPLIRMPLYAMQVRQSILQALGLLAAFPALLGTWRIQAWLRSMSALTRPGQTPRRPGKVMSDLLFVREALRRLMVLFSLMIGAVVFATGALRSAYLAVGHPHADFPAVSVLLFGGLFTAMLALLFVPVYVDQRAFRRHMRDSLSRFPRDGRPAEDWYAQRERLTGLLQLNSGALEAVQVTTAVLGPLLGALVTLFVPDLKI
ncbi:hypothetical protein [Streptomyces sp. NPDC001833]|uniref:hypothetical protein n=1 Tax=Streptomyces sp. NPDC001833 TaxID=3154658 RepID=UPI00332C5297